MKTVEILMSHTGYPSGKKRSFTKGEEAEVPDAYADLITSEAKRLAREIPAPQGRKPSPPSAAPAAMPKPEGDK